MIRRRTKRERQDLINKSHNFIPTHVVQSIDRIQLSIKNRGANYELLLREFRNSMTFIRETRESFNDGYRIIWTFRCHAFFIHVVFYGKPWFSVQVLNPDEEIQTLLHRLISRVVPSDAVSLSQVEFALDFYPEEQNRAHDQFLILSKHVVKNGLRAKGARRIETTHYQGNNGNIHKSSAGLRIYPKEEHGYSFTRVELEVHRQSLNEHGFNFNNLPLAPEAINVLDYIAFRKKMNLDVTAKNYARSRMARSDVKDPRRNYACLITLISVLKNILDTALTSNPRYTIDELTAAEEVSLLKDKLPPNSRFKINLDRHFPRFPEGQCGRVRWKI